MFGSHPMLERKLRKNGTSALARVIACERNDLLSQKQSVPGGVGAPKSLCKLQLEVMPGGEPAFEVTTEAWLVGTEGAHEGMTVPGLFDPSDRTKVIVDESDAAWKAADRENMKARRAERAAASGQDPARLAAIEEMRRAAAEDPTAFLARMQEEGPAAFGLPGVRGAPPLCPHVRGPCRPLDEARGSARPRRAERRRV